MLQRQQQFLCTAMFLLAAAVLLACGSSNQDNKELMYHPKMPPRLRPHECGSIDIRNDCDELWQLNGCTVIRGYLKIVLLPKKEFEKRDNVTVVSNNTCNYDLYSFPQLREITDYLIFYKVRGLRTVRHMFPNLTVIRGERLFLNYALGITSMPDLQLLEFPSLVAIQRGHVFVASSEQLCQLQQINWSRLTLSSGENLIYPDKTNTCDHNDHNNNNSTLWNTRNYYATHNSSTPYFWSSRTPQYFENDNLVDLKAGLRQCHEECLGGCYNTTSQGCVVCRHLTQGGNCVKTCAKDRFFVEHFQRCYTRDECVNMLGYYTHEAMCISDCPSGYMHDQTTHICVPCPAGDGCIKVCQPNQHHMEDMHVPFTIYSLAEADALRGCHTLNASVLIMIRNPINEAQLERNLASVREIRGHLKIYRSPYLTSLKFFSNLLVIHGKPQENGLYALIIYDNARLSALWQPIKSAGGQSFELQHGSIYVHRNDRLCQHLLLEFRDQVVHDSSHDSLQQNDQAVLCTPTDLQVGLHVLSQHAVQLSWRRQQTATQLRVLYKRLGDDANDAAAKDAPKLQLELEQESNVCDRRKWEQRIVLRNELQDNGTHHSYTLDGLATYTSYVVIVKSFGGTASSDNKTRAEAASEPFVATTLMDLPTPPALKLLRKTESSLTVVLTTNPREASVSHFVLQVYALPEAPNLAQRDYCTQPFPFYQLKTSSYGNGADGGASKRSEDYEACCARRVEELQDDEFVLAMQEDFACTLEKPQNCGPRGNAVSVLGSGPTALINLRLEANETTYTLKNLKRYQLYVVQVKACRDDPSDGHADCSAYSMLAERSDRSLSADKLVDLRACWSRVSGTYHVQFSEPAHPNGMIVAYMIHLRVELPLNDTFQSHVQCLTRAQHATASYEFVLQRQNVTYREVAVRVYSLASDELSQWMSIVVCEAPTTKVAGFGGDVGRQSHGLNIFLICFLLGAGGTLIWICYKRRYWRKLPALRRYMPLTPLRRSWRTLLQRHGDTDNMEDRQILVDGFETVRFHNNDDDEQKYLE